MNTKLSSTSSASRLSASRLRRAAIALVCVTALGACTSDPGPKRVAQDIIKAEALANPNLEEECLLAELDKFSAQELKDLGDLLISESSDRQAEGAPGLKAFEDALSVCNSPN